MDQNVLREALFSNRTQLYGVLDGVMVPELPKRLFDGQVPNECLLVGELPDDMIHAAPYLVHLSPDSKFADWVLENSIGKHWGILAQTQRSMTEMRRHFRALHQVYDERGNPMKFRFFDPRVLNKFLPTCNGGELRTFFGEVLALFAENEDGSGMNKFMVEEGKLKTRSIGKET